MIYLYNIIFSKKEKKRKSRYDKLHSLLYYKIFLSEKKIYIYIWSFSDNESQYSFFSKNHTKIPSKTFIFKYSFFCLCLPNLYSRPSFKYFILYSSFLTSFQVSNLSDEILQDALPIHKKDSSYIKEI